MVKSILVCGVLSYLALGSCTVALDEHARKEWREKATEAFVLAVGVALTMWVGRMPPPPDSPTQPEASKTLRRLVAEEQARAAVAAVLLAGFASWSLIVACCDPGVTCGVALGLLLCLPLAVSRAAGE